MYAIGKNKDKTTNITEWNEESPNVAQNDKK